MLNYEDIRNNNFQAAKRKKKKGSLLRYFLELHSKLTFKVLLEAMTVVTCKWVRLLSSQGAKWRSQRATGKWSIRIGFVLRRFFIFFFYSGINHKSIIGTTFLGTWYNSHHRRLPRCCGTGWLVMSSMFPFPMEGWTWWPFVLLFNLGCFMILWCYDWIYDSVILWLSIHISLH